MNIDSIGAHQRPKLFPAYGVSGGQLRPAVLVGPLSRHDLRRIVAGMIG